MQSLYKWFILLFYLSHIQGSVHFESSYFTICDSSHSLSHRAQTTVCWSRTYWALTFMTSTQKLEAYLRRKNVFLNVGGSGRTVFIFCRPANVIQAMNRKAASWVSRQVWQVAYHVTKQLSSCRQVLRYNRQRVK